MTDKELLTMTILHQARSMKHNLIAHAYINIGLKMTKRQCIDDLWNFYENNQDNLHMFCKMCDLDLETVNKIYQVLYNGFIESKIIINNYYKERSNNNEG